MADKPKRPTHLSTLFHIGEEVVVTDLNDNEYPIWVARPTALQQEEARDAANGRMARYKHETSNHTSDKYLSISTSLATMPKKDLLEQRTMHEETRVREAAINEVLYGEAGSDWATDDAYFSLITATADRWDEIEKYNESMKDGGSGDRIDPMEDEELERLNKQQELFTNECEDLYKEMMLEEVALHDVKSRDDLTKELIEMTVELESKMMWFETYQMRMLYYACRYEDDHDRFYFESRDDVLEMPQYIRQQLYQAYEAMDRGTGDLKNSLSLPSSFPS